LQFNASDAPKAHMGPGGDRWAGDPVQERIEELLAEGRKNIATSEVSSDPS
jgi:hypothetical protein